MAFCITSKFSKGGECAHRHLCPVEGVAVDVDIVLSAALPAVVAHHGAPHQLMPAVVVLDAPERAANSVLHIRSIVVLKGEAVAVVVGGIEYGVLQAAYLTHYGDSAVAERDHLRQTAGLLRGGHEEDVGAGVDLARQLGNEAVAEDESAGVLRLHMVEEVLVFLVARAEDDELHILGVHQLFQTHAHQIQALVRNQTGDHGNQRNAPVDLEGEALLQAALVFALAAHILLGVVAVDLIVGGRVVACEIDAVLDAAELVMTEVQLVVQTPAVPRILDLRSVAWRNGGNAGRGLNSALHHIELAVHLENMALAGGDADALGVDFPAVLALILDVVDGEQALDVVVPGSVGIEQIVVHGNQSCLPVVGVDDVGMEVDVGQHLQNGAGEERKALGVVIVTVEGAALEVVFVVDEVVGAVVPASPEQAAVLVSPRDGHGEVGDEVHLILQILRDGAVERNNDAAVLSLSAQGMRKAARNVGKTAAAAEGIRLGSTV